MERYGQGLWPTLLCLAHLILLRLKYPILGVRRHELESRPVLDRRVQQRSFPGAWIKSCDAVGGVRSPAERESRRSRILCIDNVALPRVGQAIAPALAAISGIWFTGDDVVL